MNVGSASFATKGGMISWKRDNTVETKQKVLTVPDKRFCSTKEISRLI